MSYMERLLNNIKREGIKQTTFRIFNIFIRRKRLRMPLPSFLQIEPTTICNFKCITCSRESLPDERLNKSITLEQIKKIVAQNKALKTIKLQGLGEPLLTPNLDQILDYLEEKRIRIVTITNGSLLTIERYRKLAMRFDEIRISFDSVNKEQFQNIRIGSNFDTIIKGIKLLISERNIKKSKSPYVAITFVVTHLNFNEIPKLKDLATELGVDEVGIVEVENWYTPHEVEFHDSKEFVENSRIYSDTIRNMVEALSKELKKKNIILSFLSSDKRKDKCKWPFEAAFITNDGFVTPCCIRMNSNIVNFGNINETSFKLI